MIDRDTRHRASDALRPRLSRRLGEAAAIVVSGLAMLLSAPRSVAAQVEATREYQIKAAFLFNFLQFVTWQDPECAGVEGAFVIGVLGEDRFGTTLDELVRGETMMNRPLAVERYAEVQQVGRCQVLFVSNSEAAGLDAIFTALAGRSVLSVGETPGFAESRGVIALELSGSRVRLEINTGAANAANLSISSKLLRLAEVVRTVGS